MKWFKDRAKRHSASHYSLSISATCGAVVIVLLIISGCADHPPQTGRASSQPTTAVSEPRMLTVTGKSLGDPRDPQPALSAMVHLDIYLHDMPVGTVSGDEQFWKRIDEQSLGTDISDRLKKNGIRCGIAPPSEWEYFQHFFQVQPHHARKQYIDALHTESIELSMQKKFEHQDLFFLNAADQLEGRSYTDGEDGVALTFGPTPRDLSAVHLTLCPVVRSHKSRLQFTTLNQEYETPINDVDRVYDLNLSADLPDGGFFIIAPTPDANRTTTVGGCFFTRAERAQKLEEVIVIVPTFVRVNGRPTSVRDLLK